MFVKRDESTQKGDDNTLRSKQGGGDNRKCYRKLQNKSQSEKFSKPATIKQNGSGWFKEFSWMDFDENENAV